MNYPLSENNPICRLLGHFGKPYDSGGIIRVTCPLDGHTVPPFPRVPQSREDYDAWVARGRPVDDQGNWKEAS